MEFRSKYTVKPYPGLDCGQDSITVPDDTLSIRELLLRFTKGSPPEGTARDGVYDPDEDWNIPPEFEQNRDLSDLDELQEEQQNLARHELQKSADRRRRNLGRTAKQQGATTRPAREIEDSDEPHEAPARKPKSAVNHESS